MPDFLTRRDGTWHFVRRVPAEFSQYDKRGIVRKSTKIRVAKDRTGRQAFRVAERLNSELEAFWAQITGRGDLVAQGHDQARHRACAMGFDYIENDQLVSASLEKIIERLDTLGGRDLRGDAGARAALLGTQPRPSILLSTVFTEYEDLMQDRTKKFSRNQLRVWRNSRIRVVNELVGITGDKPITELIEDDGLDYVEWWR